MDVVIRFWNNSKKQAETRYLTSEFLYARPNAENLVNLLSSALKDLDQQHLLKLSGWPFSQLECFGYSI